MQFPYPRGDVGQPDAVRHPHWPALSARETVAREVHHVDVAGPLCDPTFEQARALVDDCEQAALEDLLPLDGAAADAELRRVFDDEAFEGLERPSQLLASDADDCVGQGKNNASRIASAPTSRLLVARLANPSGLVAP